MGVRMVLVHKGLGLFVGSGSGGGGVDCCGGGRGICGLMENLRYDNNIISENLDAVGFRVLVLGSRWIQEMDDECSAVIGTTPVHSMVLCR